jgi:hypothetical protein
MPFRVVLPVASYRKFPDPVQAGLYHHHGYLPASHYPETGFPAASAESLPIDRQKRRELADSLLNIDCTPNLFHLKCQGEYHAASEVREVGPDETRRWVAEHAGDPENFVKHYKLIEVLYQGEGDGIIDGREVDRLLRNPTNRADGSLNHVRMEWVVGLKPGLTSEIAAARNVTLRVPAPTLGQQAEKFEWLRAVLAAEPYGSLIAYREDDEKPIDVRELVSLLAPFNRDLYTLRDEPSKKSSVLAFTSRGEVVADYLADMSGPRTFAKLKPIARDILQLHDLIHLGVVAKAGAAPFVDARSPHTFPFTKATGGGRLADGVLYPMLAAFSALVTTRDGAFGWSTQNGFAGVKALWDSVAGSFVESTSALCEQLGNNTSAVGRSTYHWKNLYREVAFQAAS